MRWFMLGAVGVWGSAAACSACRCRIAPACVMVLSVFEVDLFVACCGVWLLSFSFGVSALALLPFSFYLVVSSRSLLIWFVAFVFSSFSSSFS